MTCISRRKLVAGAAVASLLRSSPVSALGRHESGYPQIDAGVRPALETLTRLFGLSGNWKPDFSFFDESGAPEARVEDGIEGIRRVHVKVGRKAIEEAIRIGNGHFGAALTGVLAHEIAHIYQQKSGLRPRLLSLDAASSHLLIEMHADFLGGWALPQAWWITDIAHLKIAADQFYALGDTMFDTLTHHGTSLQRQTVMSAGYTWGLSKPNDADAAAERGFTLLKDLFPQWIKT